MATADPAPRLQQARLAEFQRTLNEQFDACRRTAHQGRAHALRRACAGVALLCHLQQHLLQPVLGPTPDGLAAVQDLLALSGRSSADDAQQRAVAALLEGLVQLQFAQLDAALAAADLSAARWAELDRAVNAMLADWWAEAARALPAGHRQGAARGAAYRPALPVAS